jgi:oxygen-independent coproporphyrinogen III oxidase
MWTFHPDLLTASVPRYTSYPTAVEFHDGIGAQEFLRELDQLASEEAISLYLHIPYCQQICWYCGCNTGAAGREKRLTSYLAALEAEVMLVATRLAGRGRVKNIAFGGGSPNAIAPVEFARLVDRLTTMFRCDDPAISVELDPRIFTPEWATTPARCGVSRVSLGVQSFAPEIQAAIGRIQPASMIAECVSQLRSAGISAINFDLMYGLPTQSCDDLAETIETAIAFAPNRIALFGYAHMPQLFPRQRRIDGTNLPGSEVRFEMAQRGYLQLGRAGYRAIGFDHFALPDDSLARAADERRVRRNFQGFTDDSCKVMIGFGASAISDFGGHILQNEKNPGRYRMLASSGHPTASRGLARSDNDRRRGEIIERLLCNGDSGSLSPPLISEISGCVEPFMQRGLARLEDGYLRIEPAGLPYSRAIASLFDTYRKTEGNRFSLAI